MKNKRKILFRVLFLFILAAVTALGVSAYIGNEIGVNRGSISYCLQSGRLTAVWQPASDGDRYRFFRYDEDSGEYFFCGEYADGSAELMDVAPGRELKLKVQGVRTVKAFGYDWELKGKPRILTIVPEELEIPVLTKIPDPGQKRMKLTWDTEPGDRYEVYLMNGEDAFERYAETEEGEIFFCVEDHMELSGREKGIGVAVRAIRRKDDYILCSSVSPLTMINRAELMEDDPHLNYEESGDHRYLLSWKESKGDWYELQEWSFADKKWIGRQVYQWSEPLRYDTGRLPSCTKQRFRVISYDDTQMRDREEYAAKPSEVTFRTGLSPLYCTVWPLTALDVFEDASGNKASGQVPAGKALCVLEETGEYFRIRYDNQYGYIDSRYCLIDLAEYLGNLCKYNITNSYSSVFRVHGYDIPEVTGNIIQGYENVHLKNGQMLVPYLYPCAQKLYQAALHAERDGYILYIYDAFRPNEATRYLYDTAAVVLDQPVQEKEEEDTEEEENAGDQERAEKRKSIEDEEATEEKESIEDEKAAEERERAEDENAAEKEELTVDDRDGSEPETPEELLEKMTALSEELQPQTIGALKGMSEETLTAFYEMPLNALADMSFMEPGTADESGAVLTSPMTQEEPTGTQNLQAEDIPVLKELSWEELQALKQYADSVLTYREVMTDNRFRLGSFLAQTVSTHNRGIALDLTLCSASSDEELEMQSDMHDLSWYSIPAQNNTNAELLASYMEEVGYRGISSEWWHFQDDETRNQLKLGYMDNGISPEGWKRDDLGWKYRREDGSCYCADTVMIDKKECTFNEDGYLIEE